MRKILKAGAVAVVAGVVAGLVGCGNDKTEIPSTFQAKPDKPPVGAGVPGGGKAGGKGGATSD